MNTQHDAFARPGDDWGYFDNAGGSFVLRAVVERVADYLATCPVQLGGGYPLSRLASERQAEAVAALAQLVGAMPGEIVLGSSATALTWQVARALRPLLAPGDEIIVTRMDHEANRSPWLSLRDADVTVRQWNIDPESWRLSLDELDRLLGERTRLVCFSHGSNVLGEIEPVEEIARRAHAAGAKVFVDGVAVAPHRRLQLARWGVDFYVLSLYKLFGPHLGLLYGRREALLALGNINHEYLAADALPYKLQPGGASYELVWGAAAIAEYFDARQRLAGRDPFDEIAEHESRLIEPLLDFLAAHPKVTLLGSASCDSRTRLPILSFRHAARASADIVAHLAVRKLAARNGHFNARRLLEFLGLPPDDGVVRISFAHYNTNDEVDRLVAALNEIL